MERNQNAFWLYKGNLVPIYEEDTHCYFLLFHYDEVGIPKEMILEYVQSHGFESIKEAQDTYFDPWEIKEFDDFWLGLRILAYRQGLIRLGFADEEFLSSGEFYLSCKDIKAQKNRIMDCLIEHKKFHNFKNYYIEDMDMELSRRNKGHGGHCIEAHSLNQVILELDSY